MSFYLNVKKITVFREPNSKISVLKLQNVFLVFKNVYKIKKIKCIKETYLRKIKKTENNTIITIYNIFIHRDRKKNY